MTDQTPPPEQTPEGALVQKWTGIVQSELDRRQECGFEQTIDRRRAG